MIIIKEIKHVLVFDADNQDYEITNFTDELETILNESGVFLINEDKAIGYLSDVQNRPHTGLYFGNITLKDEIANKIFEFTKPDFIFDHKEEQKVHIERIFSRIKVKE